MQDLSNSASGVPAQTRSGVRLGRDVRSGEDVELPDALRTRGVTVIGKTGTGKSTLLEQLVLEDLRHGTPAVVIDPHGRLVSRVLSLAPASSADRLLLLEPWPDRPFRLNLLDCPDPDSDTAVDRTVDHAVEVFKKLFDRSEEYQPRLERDLDAAVRTAIPNRGTLLDVLRLFADAQLRERYRAGVTEPAVQEYWDYFDRLGREAERARQVEATVNRLYRMLAPRLIRRIVDSHATTVPFDAVLAGDRMLLLSIPARDLTPKRCDFLGALFLAALTERIFTRQAAVADPPRLHLYIDEYARFATPMTAELFAEGRKYGVGLTVAHQTLAQVTDEVNRAAERQAGTLVFFQLIGPDAEELAGELDTTPVRTKTVMRQRTVPQYREWDEQVWDDPAVQREHEELQAQLAHVVDTVGKPLARRKAAYYMLEAAYTRAGWDQREAGPAFDALRADETDSVRAHLPFNPESFSVVFPGSTAGGLRKVGEPDFWNPDFPAELRTLTCEGYVLKQQGQYIWDHLRDELGVITIKGLHSRLHHELEQFVRPTHGSDPFKDLVHTHRQDFVLLSEEELRDVAKDLVRQTTVLHEHYQAAVFWFLPYSARAVRSSGKELAPESEAELAEETSWLQRTRPELGEERGVRYHYAQYPSDLEVRAHISSLQWPQLGCWQVTAFPRLVAHLKRWAQEKKRDICILEDVWEWSRPRLEDRIRELTQAHFKTVHRKEYLGEVPCMKHTLPPPKPEHRFIPRDRYGRPLYPEIRIPDDKQQWYDPVEELDQTHADRRLELANELVNLPPFTFYSRTTTAQQHVALGPPVPAIIDETRIEEIRRTSKARFGRQTAPPVPPPPGSPAPSAGPRITRAHPDGE